MMVMGESSFWNIDYGDWEICGFINFDGFCISSIGLFQQQDWWGSVEQWMDLVILVMLFFDCLGWLFDWQVMDLLYVIYWVQVNIDCDYYVCFQVDVMVVVDVLFGFCI